MSNATIGRIPVKDRLAEKGNISISEPVKIGQHRREVADALWIVSPL